MDEKTGSANVRWTKWDWDTPDAPPDVTVTTAKRKETIKDLRRERDALREKLLAASEMADHLAIDRDYWREMYQSTAEALRLTQDRLVAELDK